MPSYLITGASRGLGLAFTTELLNDPANLVIATARSTSGSKGLQDLAAKYPKERLILVDLDVTDLGIVQQVAKQLDTLVPEGLDNFISNAGVAHGAVATFDDLDLDAFEDELHFNLVVLVNLLRAFLPSIKKSKQKKILIISSSLGSIELGGYMPNLANTYSIAKAALNMLVRKWGAVLKRDGVTSILLHPGWVSSTEIGDSISDWIAENAPDIPSITSDVSAAGSMKVLKEATLEDAVSFFNFDGTKLPW
ncbi:putative short-chain dehydrogenases/reductase [Coniochaeta ligniaria NRRL 30616]|uniref:Putative short-chain dehydrogenases/reductase n=1 Tax=Coniochaeta ligniaria NRRL 30616 TaxID=1408157 RepID=A0A1J7ISB7_9PEZI|nr:putative short-chain dehydrogenases/reductase [Coniochaeta ligniaria NRRL 30616]